MHGKPALNRATGDELRADTSLEEERGFIIKLLNTVDALVLVLDRDGRIVRFNRACEKATGYSFDEVRGRRVWEFLLVPEEAEPVKNVFENLKAGMFPNRNENWWAARDGRRLLISWSNTALLDGNGEVEFIVPTGIDMTGRKRVEEQLYQAQRDWEDTFNTITDMVTVHDKNFNIIRANKAAEQILGLPLLAAGGVKCYEHYHGSECPPARCASCRSLVTGKPAVEELFEPHLNMFVEIRAMPRFDSDNNLIGLIHVVRDISKRKQAEDDLQRHVHFLQIMMDTIPAPVFYKDATGRYLGCNKAFESVIGSTREQIIGKSDFDIMPKELADIYFEADRALEQQGDRTAYESSVVYADSTSHQIIFNKAVFQNPDGRTGGTVGVMLDITERKKLEEQLFQSQKMEAVGQLAGGIAHDFNNILSVITGYGSILQTKIRHDDPARTHVDQILASSKRAANLTNSLLAFSRKQIVNPRLVALNEVVRNAQNFLARIIGEDIELRTGLSEDNTTVTADTGQIEQVLMNLAANARDVMPDGGLLSIETEITELDEEFIKKHPYAKAGTYVLLSVTDVGAGMDEHTRARIFEPFFTTKEGGKGTGLGLAIVYGIIKQHKGYIHVYSEKGIGTTFKIYLPLVKAEADRKKEPVAQPVIKGGTETILVAEDDEMVRTFMGTALRSFGYRVIEAVDGEDAVSKYRENKDSIRMLILDVVMPGKNGKEVHEEIRKIGTDIRALFASGYPAEIMHEKGILDEGVNFIWKPASPGELLKKIREILDKDMAKEN